MNLPLPRASVNPPGIIALLMSIIASITHNGAFATEAYAVGISASVDPYIQEKIILVTNKDGYAAGDTIRFRAFLLDAASERQLKDFSQYIYVELIDPLGATFDRVK